MLFHRRVILALCIALSAGTLLASGLFALQVNSRLYLRSIEREVSEWTTLDTKIGRIRPMSWDRRGFENVEAFDPESGEQIFSAKMATWMADESDEIGLGKLLLEDGWLLIGASDWSPSEYEMMLKRGLGQDYKQAGLGEILLDNIDLRFLDPRIELKAKVTAGVVEFGDDGTGQASLSCSHLNGTEVIEPVNIASRFTPGSSLTIHDVRMTIPEIPLSSLGIEQLLGANPTQGVFEGVITIKPDQQDLKACASGSVHNALLGELTGTLPGGPFHGLIDVSLDDLQISDGKITRLELHNKITNLELADYLPELSSKQQPATANLMINRLEWNEGKLAYFSAKGECAKVLLQPLSRMIGQGEITGSATVTIRSILIVDDELLYADVQIDATPPEDKPGTIDRAMLASAAQKVMGVDISPILPENIEYVALGANLIIERGKLRVYGSHGPENATILTIVAAGQPMPLLPQPKEPYDISSLLGEAEGYVSKLDLATLREWWIARQEQGD